MFKLQPGEPFSACYVRYKYPSTLGSKQIRVATLKTISAKGTVTESLCLQNASSQINVLTGFSLEIPELGWLYGTRVGDYIEHLGLLLNTYERPTLDKKMIGLLKEFLREYDLMIVNWFAGQVIEGEID